MSVDRANSSSYRPPGGDPSLAADAPASRPELLRWQRLRAGLWLVAVVLAFNFLVTALLLETDFFGLQGPMQGWLFQKVEVLANRSELPLNVLWLMALLILARQGRTARYHECVGALIVMAVIDVTLSVMELPAVRAEVAKQLAGHNQVRIFFWSLSQFGMLLGWIELWLLGTVTAEVCRELGERAVMHRGLAVAHILRPGFILWALACLAWLDFGAGWPPRLQPLTPTRFLLELGWQILLLIALSYSAATCSQTARACGRRAAALAEQIPKDGPTTFEWIDHERFNPEDE